MGTAVTEHQYPLCEMLDKKGRTQTKIRTVRMNMESGHGLRQVIL